MNKLHQKILDAARDEVAREMQYSNWFAFTGSEKFRRGPWVFDKRAFDKAMDKQTVFYREISHQGYVCLFRSQLWTNPKTDETKPELELYEIFTTQQ